LGGENWSYYVHPKRDDPGLIYSVESCTNLVSGTWATNGVEFVGESAIMNNYKTVTNRVSMAGKPQQFIRLKVEKP
jgi:hypothetical protein